MNEIIKELQELFLKEAKSSPMLLSDLASMETYIAESYQERSIIELLQNADDALSNRFFIKKVKESIIVANDGRKFTADDVMAICRSGSSTKKRRGVTIGYRGIGFKSVVNLADRVHIISSDIALTFSRQLTSNLMQEDLKVPLIRIPHDYTPIEDHEKVISELLEDNFNTIFIFEQLKQDNLDNEVEYFDSSSLLFLRRTKQVEFDTNFSKLINVNRKNNGNYNFVTIIEDGIKENWLVYRKKSNEAEAIAFLVDENMTLVPLEAHRSVVHSFMPTKDNVGLPVKINGDFSTDPSRTKVTYDDSTKSSMEECCKLIVEIINYHMRNPEYHGLFDILSKKEESVYSKFSTTQKFKESFIQLLRNSLDKSKWFYNRRDGKDYCSERLKANPEWLNESDFLDFCTDIDCIPLGKQYESIYPGFLKFSETYGVKILTIEEALQNTINRSPTINGGIEVLTEIIKKYRFHLESIKEDLNKAKIIKFSGEGFLSLNELNGREEIDSEYYEGLKIKLNDFNDLTYMFKTLNSPLNIKEYNSLYEHKNHTNSIMHSNTESKLNYTLSTKTQNNESNNKVLKFNSTLQKWRSVEVNLVSFLQLDESIDKVVDVSKSNLGYDIEIYRGSDKEYIEVKSVERIGGTISITNNEYSTANEFKEKYILAIASQTNEGLEVCFIKDPLNNLDLIKRVTRWEWICDSYEGELNFFRF